MLQLFTETIKIKSIYKGNSNAKLQALGAKTKWSKLKLREAQALLEEATLVMAENFFFGANINNQSKSLSFTNVKSLQV